MNEDTYGTNAVYGSLAYDFNNPALFPELTQEPTGETVAPPETREREKAVPVTRPRYAVAPTAIVGAALAAVVLVFSLLARVELVGLSDEATELTDRLAVLEEDRTRLLIAYESTFNLHEIEGTAILELGMQKARGDQILYVGGSAPDKAVVLAEDSSRFTGRVREFLDMVGACFR